MNVVRKLWQSFFPAMPQGRRRRQRTELWLVLGLGLLAALLAGAAIYLLQDRLTR